MNKRNLIFSITLALVAGALLVASLKLPLWHMRMEAPQYRGPEALKVFVLPGSLRGNISEIKILNQYIGVTIPDSLPQTHWMPTALCVVAALGIFAALLPLRARRFAGFGLAIALSATMIFAAVQAQSQMYRIGHDRDRHAALKGVEDFTPPLLGTRKVAQFELASRLGLGSFCIASAVVIYAAIGFASREKSTAKRRLEKIETSEHSMNSSEVIA
jgi:hypothetical protein